MAAVSMEQVWVCGEVKEYHGALHRSLTKKNGETIDILPRKASPSQTLKKKKHSCDLAPPHMYQLLFEHEVNASGTALVM